MIKVQKKYPWYEPLFVLIIYYLLIYFLARVGYYLFSDFIEANYQLIRLIDLGVIIIMLLILWGYFRIRKLTFPEAEAFSFKILFYCFLLALLTRIILDPITWQDYIFYSENDIPQTFTIRSNIQLLLEFLYLVLLVPVLEEIIFRFLILRSFTLRYGKIIGLLVSTLAFSIIHINFVHPNLISAEFSLVLGLILGLVYLRTGIYGAIITHSLYNFCNWIISCDKSHYYNLLRNVNFDFRYWTVIILSLFATIIFFIKWQEKIAIKKEN